MKPKNLFQLMGFKGKPKHFSYEIMECSIKNIGPVKYAQWLHPNAVDQIINADLVDAYGEYIKEGDFCIDIGAHCGDTSLPMGLAAGKTGSVLALEPNPYVYPVLEKTARSNSDIANIKTVMAAAGLEEGFMVFEYSDSGFCNGGRHENISALRHGHAFNQTVFAINLEQELKSDYAALLPKLSFIKIDSEGYDLYILRSIEGILKEYHPVIKAEVFKKTDYNYRNQLLSFLLERGYSVFKITGEPLTKGEPLTQKNIDVGTHYDILALPDTCSMKIAS
ncbi:FkbM family methyltransferase [Desulfoluna butyratoxydans]|uniref:S-adenosyl-l-methionine-dependent methyltransferase n=1 Tax=Desulfoluna butyratoxydans TaxID=231438 RepID=A0A4U8YNC5_9BACT|nr:FkbM family methyltransferase [Desulfoluna butyratoxydans]VFQ45310.1 s-adenosyl-l-methionine-dependent methyltransferase [Desulfoluna butyratoxydans]